MASGEDFNVITTPNKVGDLLYTKILHKEGLQMADTKDLAVRFGTLTLAALFLVTSVAFTVVIFWQSRQQDSDDLTAEQQQTIDDAINQSNETGEDMLEGTQLSGFTPITTDVTELQIIDLVEGTGEVVRPGATVTAHYTGALVNTGVIFQSSHDSGSPIPFSLSGVIAGWTEGVPGMKVGGTRRLIIPAAKAYGEAPEGYVYQPGNSPLGPLVFDIELVAVEQ